jgi:hypothetical protein
MYILKCSDGTYYAGSAKDLEYRVFEHQEGKGAKYTSRQLPVKFSESRFHVTLSERSLLAKSLGTNCRRLFVARRALTPHAERDKPVIY